MNIENLTEEQLEQALASKRKKAREEKESQRRSYEEMKADAVISLTCIAKNLSNELAEFKKLSFDTMATIYQLLQEYSSRHADGKGNFRIEVGNFRVSYKRQGKPTFDEKADQAEKHIIDFVNTKFAKDPDTKDLIMSLLERKKGDLDINLIQKLYAMEDRFADENWKKGIELLKESYHFSHSKDYIGFEERNDKGEWATINLQFSSL